MDTDLMNLWLNAEYLSQAEARELITELQRHRDDDRAEAAGIRKAFDKIIESNVTEWSGCVAELADAVEAWESR